MNYIKLDSNNVVVQKQPNDEAGFHSVSDSITCGMVHDGTGNYGDSNFTRFVNYNGLHGVFHSYNTKCRRS